jgi:phosphatidylglycerophosphatase A
MSIFLRPHYGNAKLSAKQIMTDPVLFLAFGFGSGLAKKAPGTCGTVAAIPVYYLLSLANNFWLYSIFTVIATVVGVWLCDVAAKKLDEHDYGGIVWDEVAGYLITMWFVTFSWQAMLLGFVLFRIFDIIKPFPIRWIDQHVHGGLGIMLDDVLAAVFAGALLLVAVHWLPLS